MARVSWISCVLVCARACVCVVASPVPTAQTDGFNLHPPLPLRGAIGGSRTVDRVVRSRGCVVLFCACVGAEMRLGETVGDDDDVVWRCERLIQASKGSSSHSLGTAHSTRRWCIEQR